ncbi:MAG: protein-disulfide isomerase [Thermodesulfovibrio sp.]|nr:protein-disulfide isomerase [Thermodesulfovibrio sp.]
MKKLLISALTIGLAITAGYQNASAYAKSEQACTKCHTLNADQAKDVLKEIVPDIKILEVKDGPVSGLWEVAMESGNKKGIMYIDYSKKNLIAGNIFGIKTKTNFTQVSYEKINKIDVSSIPLGNALVMGDKNAKNKVIVFSDPDCPYCGKLHEQMKIVLTKRKDIAFYVMLFPLPMHQDAGRKSKTIMCENSVSLLEDAFAKKKIADPKCDTKAIDENIKLAEKLGISGTPNIIFPDGKQIPGAVDADKIIEAVDKK